MSRVNSYIYLVCYLTAFLLAASAPLLAQPVVYPVRATAQMIVGGSVYIGDFANAQATADRLRFNLSLQDPVEAQRTVYFRLYIVQNGTLIASNPVGFRGNLVTLERNVPLTINGEDLAQNLNINNLAGLTGSHAYGVLNEGVTDICIEVIDAFRGEPISDRVCATGYLTRLQAPILILPVEGQNLFESQLNNMVFTWQMTDPLAHLPGVNIDYLFELREKSPLLDPQDQFENHTLVFSTAVSHFSVFYNELTSQLDPGKVYIWRVTAQFFDQGGNRTPEYFVNNGISRVGLFHVLPDLVIGPGDSGVSCLCPEDECDVVFPALTQLKRNLTVGDSVKFGAFHLKISELDGSGSSGAGSIRLPFLNTSVSVGFNHINVNDRFEVTHGNVSALASQLVSRIGIDPDNLPDLSAISVDMPWLNEMNSHVSRIREAMSLPLSLGNTLSMLGFSMPFEVFVTDIDFNAYGTATANLLLVIPGSDGQFYNFGATGVRIGRNGFDMASLKLFLLNDISLPGLTSLPLQIRRAVLEGEGSGSFISFGCSGLERFNLQCSYTFPQDQLIRADGSDEPVVADLTIQSRTWGQFTGFGDIPDFEVKGAPGWQFSTTRIVLDLDRFDNPQEVSFPEGYPHTSPDWQGFYVERVSVTFPEDINDMASNGDPIVFETGQIILDGSGVTCTATAANVLDISTGSAGGWAFSIDSIGLNLWQNRFVDAYLAGRVGVEILEAELSYRGLIFKDNRGSYAFNLSPVGSFEIPFLKLTAAIETGSLLAFERVPQTGKYRPYADLNLMIDIHVPESDLRGHGMGTVVDELKGLLGVADFDFGLRELRFNHFKVNHPDLPPGKWFGLEDIEGGEIVVPGLEGMDLGQLMLLELPTDFSGITLPAVGLEIQVNFGLASVGLGVWAKQQARPPGDTSSYPRYSFGKFELALPDFSGMSFRCDCEAPPAQGEAPQVNYCLAPDLTGGTLTAISADDRVKAGHFTLRIDELTGPGQGRGKMEIPFLRILLDVEFSDMTVHIMPGGEKRMVSGVVVSAANALLGDYSVEVTDTPGPANLTGLSVTQEFMDQLDNMAAEAASFFTLPLSLRDKMQSLFGVTLPEGFDFILLGIRFEAGKARLSAMLTVKLPGDNYLKFGLAGMQVRPDGFNMDGIQIYLAEDFTADF